MNGEADITLLPYTQHSHAVYHLPDEEDLLRLDQRGSLIKAALYRDQAGKRGEKDSIAATISTKCSHCLPTTRT